MTLNGNNMTETILGIRGPDFVMLSSDTMQIKSWVVIKDDQPKVCRLTEFSMMAVVGDGGDSIQFTDFISKNINLYRIVNGYSLSPRAIAHYTRKNLAEYIRTNTKYDVSILLAGFDATEGSALHFIDSLGAAQSINHGGHGVGSKFCTSIFQHYWHKNLSQEEAYEILKKGVAEIQKRLVTNLRNFAVFVVDKNGMRQMLAINPKSLLT